jgi:hypothetical protein
MLAIERLSGYDDTHRDKAMKGLEEVLKAFKTIRGNLDAISRLSISNSQKFDVPENILVDYFDKLNSTIPNEPKFESLKPYLKLSTETEFDDYYNNLEEETQKEHLQLFEQFNKKQNFKALANMIQTKLSDAGIVCSLGTIVSVLQSNPKLVLQIVKSGTVTPEILGAIAKKAVEKQQGILSKEMVGFFGTSKAKDDVAKGLPTGSRLSGLFMMGDNTNNSKIANLMKSSGTNIGDVINFLLLATAHKGVLSSPHNAQQGVQNDAQTTNAVYSQQTPKIESTTKVQQQATKM